MSNELKSCPFCGNDDPLCYPVEEGSTIHRGGCGNADCILFDDLPGNFTSREHFAEWWNTRTTPPARSYADGVEDAAKVAEVERDKSAVAVEDMKGDEGAQSVAAGGYLSSKRIAAAIRLLSQGEKA